jgi:hypothetical protein
VSNSTPILASHGGVLPLSNLHRGVLFCALDGVSDESGKPRVLGVVRAVRVPNR